MSYQPESYDLPGLPSAIHAEVAILGAMLLDAVAISDATARLRAEDFSLDSHRRVYAAMLQLMQASQGVDLVTVREALDRRKELDSIGGPAYLAYLAEGIPRNLNIESYVRIVKDASLRSQMMRGAISMSESAASGDVEAVDLAERWMQILKGIGEDAVDVELEQVGAFLDGRAATAGTADLAATPGIKLGFSQLDDITGGLARKALVVVAAVASAGKTAFACNAAYNAAAAGHTVAFFPLEDQKDIAVRRMVSAASGVEYKPLRDGNLSPHNHRRVDMEMARLRDLPLYLDDTFDITMSRIRTRCSRLKRQLAAQGRTLDLIILDQLSHISQADIDAKLRGDEKFGRQSHLGKLLAEEMDAAVMLMCQLTQESGKRSDPTPTLFDIAGSGQIKNYARLILLLHRPEMWDKKDPSLTGLGQIIIAKNNEGMTKTCDVEYDGPCMRWSDNTPPKDRQESFGGERW